jgi:hypothetical protein
MGERAQRIPSWPGVIHSNKRRIHLRRPTCDTLTFRLRRSGGPYIPDTPSFGSDRKRIREANSAGRMLIRLSSEDLSHQALWRLFHSVSKAFLMLAYVPCSGFYSTCFWCP